MNLGKEYCIIPEMGQKTQRWGWEYTWVQSKYASLFPCTSGWLVCPLLWVISHGTERLSHVRIECPWGRGTWESCLLPHCMGRQTALLSGGHHISIGALLNLENKSPSQKVACMRRDHRQAVIGFHGLSLEWRIRHQRSAIAQKGVTLLKKKSFTRGRH